MIQTVTLEGKELKVEELGGKNSVITNKSSLILYASAFPNIEPNGNNVATILAGGVMNLYDTNGTVYLLGTGKVQLMGTNYDELPMSALITSGGGGGSSGDGVSQAYVDDADALTLKAAKEYTDTETAKIKTTVSDLSESKVDKVEGKGLSSNDFTAAEKTKLSGLENYDDTELKEEVADLKAYIGYTDSDIYGLEADFENNKFTRLAGAVGKEPGADFDSVRAFGGRRKCCLTNAGEVKAYYGDDGYDEDGMLDSQRELVQVMVEQPKFYYKVVPLKTEKIDGADGYHLRKARYYISDTPKAGFKVHPAFVRNGVEVDKIYLAAYEGCIRDMHSTSHNYIRDNAQIMDADADQLSSIVNALPATGITQELTIANARKIAQNRGAGWDITAIDTISATQLLFIIEYAAFNSQAAIGDGVVNADIPVKTGGASSLGNASGAAANGAVSYRGEENLWGNTYHYVDIGNHIFDYIPTTGYISAFSYSKNSDWAFIPSETKGNTALPVGDRAQNNRLESIAGFSAGGAYNASGNSAAVPGLFCVANIADKLHDHMRGARLICIPPVTAAQNEEVTSE